MRLIKKLSQAIVDAFDMNDWDLRLERHNSGGGADVMIDHRYRRLRIRIYDGFFTENPQWQASCIIHEFCHMFNVPMYSLLEMQMSGKIVTTEHADDILEQCNTRAETVIVKLLNDTKLKKAYNEYLKGRSPQRPVTNKKSRKRPYTTKTHVRRRDKKIRTKNR